MKVLNKEQFFELKGNVFFSVAGENDGTSNSAIMVKKAKENYSTGFVLEIQDKNAYCHDLLEVGREYNVGLEYVDISRSDFTDDCLFMVYSDSEIKTMLFEFAKLRTENRLVDSFSKEYTIEFVESEI